MRLTLTLLPIILLLACYNRSDDIGWEEYVDAKTAKTMKIIEVGGWVDSNPCNLLSKEVNDIGAKAITVCNIVFICDLPEDDHEYACLIGHEACHVKQNGTKMNECLNAMVKYGFEYGASRYLKGHSGLEAYLGLEQEQECLKIQQECLKD